MVIKLAVWIINIYLCSTTVIKFEIFGVRNVIKQLIKKNIRWLKILGKCLRMSFATLHVYSLKFFSKKTNSLTYFQKMKTLCYVIHSQIIKSYDLEKKKTKKQENVN